jgi:hypothetical protein
MSDPKPRWPSRVGSSRYLRAVGLVSIPDTSECTPRTKLFTSDGDLADTSQSRGGLQGGGVASLHNPVRASGSVAPGVSSLGVVVTQPEISQAARASLVIIFMDGSQSRASRCFHASDYPDNVCHDVNGVKMMPCNFRQSRDDAKSRLGVTSPSRTDRPHRRSGRRRSRR